MFNKIEQNSPKTPKNKYKTTYLPLNTITALLKTISKNRAGIFINKLNIF